MICSSESADLLADPGMESSLITIIYFGEEVKKLGEEAYVQNEERNYVKVRGADGKVGWVNENYFVNRGGVVAIIRESRLYRRPNTISTATMDFFEPGEVVILVGTFKQWVNLISREKKKQGWVKELDNVSSEGDDIEIATLYTLTMQETNLQSRRKKLTQLHGLARDSHSELTQVIEQALNDIPRENFSAEKTRKVANPESDYLAEIITNNRNQKVRGEIEKATGYNFQDPVTGNWYKTQTETGRVYEVSGPVNPRTVYFCYHKTRPLGSKIRIEIPDSKGYVELEVINRLRRDNPAIIGLTRDCIETIFGTRRVGEVTIFYLDE